MKHLADGHRLLPFRYTWGMLAAVLLVGLIVLAGPYSDGIVFAEDTGFGHYYWQLPDSTQWGFISAWAGYLIHQLGNWWIIRIARQRRGKFVTGLRTLNAVALLFNLICILLHIIQTKFFYDGLAQNFSPFLSQNSVVVMLMIILLMENPRRGLFFGKSVPVSRSVVDFLKSYHGYYISWALVFTFWFHPMELTAGHLLGFFYMFLLLLQGSLVFTAFHINRKWTTFLEVYVLLHAIIVAWLSPAQSFEAVLMFGFGFLTLFVVTQIYGLPISRRAIWVVSLLYLVLLALFYWGRFNEITVILRIPLAEYGLTLLMALLIWLGLKGVVRWRAIRGQQSPP